MIDGEYKEVLKREDEKGLYLLNVVAPGELEGETNEYAYMRKGRYAEGEISATDVHVTYYDRNGKVESERQAAIYVGGIWKIIRQQNRFAPQRGYILKEIIEFR